MQTLWGGLEAQGTWRRPPRHCLKTSGVLQHVPEFLLHSFRSILIASAQLNKQEPQALCEVVPLPVTETGNLEQAVSQE
jgi:hypothetical protein